MSMGIGGWRLRIEAVPPQPERRAPVIQGIVVVRCARPAGGGEIFETVTGGVDRPPLRIAGRVTRRAARGHRARLACTEALEVRLRFRQRHAVGAPGQRRRELQLETVVFPEADGADVVRPGGPEKTR